MEVLAVIDVGAREPLVKWRRDFGAPNECLLSGTRIFSLRTNAGLGFVEELDLASGASIGMFHVGE